MDHIKKIMGIETSSLHYCTLNWQCGLLAAFHYVAWQPKKVVVSSNLQPKNGLAHTFILIVVPTCCICENSFGCLASQEDSWPFYTYSEA